jgi:hypothetical protein
MISFDDQEKQGHVMTETIFTGEQIKEFPLSDAPAFFRLSLAIFPGLTKDFFVGDRPCDTGDRQCHDEDIYNLVLKG